MDVSALCDAHKEDFNAIVALASEGRLPEAKARIADFSRAHHLCPCSQFAAGYIALKAQDFHRAVADFRASASRGYSIGWSTYFIYNALIHTNDDMEAFKVLCQLLTMPDMQHASFISEVRAAHPILVERLTKNGVDPQELSGLMGEAEGKSYFVESIEAEFQSGLRADFLLGRSVASFAVVPHVRPILVTSVRKCGTHALSAVCQHLVGRARLHPSFIDRTVPPEELERSLAEGKRLFVGHVERTPAFDRIFADAFVILCVRDPLTQCMSMAHHLLNPHSTMPASMAARLGKGDETALHYALFGFDDGVWRHSSFAQEYRDVALAWWGRADKIIRFEDLQRVGDGVASLHEVFDGLEKVFEPDAIPADFNKRLAAGLDKQLSASYVKRRKTVRSPEWLPAMLETLAPGLRSFLGYPGAVR